MPKNFPEYDFASILNNFLQQRALIIINSEEVAKGDQACT